MTKDPEKIREIARVCTTLSKSAATPEERDEFAELANKWQKFAANAEAGLPLLDERGGILKRTVDIARCGEVRAKGYQADSGR
jgi:hypothetical protein